MALPEWCFYETAQTWPYSTMFNVRPNLRVCLQITEFHWTLFDPVHQDRVKKALLQLFDEVEEKVPEKAEFKRHLNDFLQGRFPSGNLVCCVPWERATQRYDDGEELSYYLSGRPDGLKVPKPAGSSAEDEGDAKKDAPASEATEDEGDASEDEAGEEPPPPAKKTRTALASPSRKRKK